MPGRAGFPATLNGCPAAAFQPDECGTHRGILPFRLCWHVPYANELSLRLSAARVQMARLNYHEDMRREFLLFWSLFAIVLGGLFQQLCLAQNTTAPHEFPISSITVEGNRILTAEGIAAASGLR